MAVEFNNLRKKFNDYNLSIGQETAKKAQKEDAPKDIEQNNVSLFKGLENDTDLLTKNAQNLYGVKFEKYTTLDKTLADETNEILESLGVKNYKVTPAQVASVEYFLKTVVPKLDQACYVATEARISSPDGPFAELFAENKNI